MEAGAGSSAAGGRPATFWLCATGGAFALAALSLLAPFEPVFDAWAWLIWGRELTGGELDTSAGASWKPGPIFVTAPASLLGDAAAPEVWLLVARTGWLMAVALAGRLAWRLARRCGAGERGAIGAGLLAAASVVLLFDDFTPWIRQFAGGLSEPLLTALLLGAVEAHLSGARRASLALLFAASLFRPETWPFLAGYGWWLWKGGEDITLRPWLVAAAVAIPVVWFVPDLIGSGSATSGAGRAAVADDEGPLVNGLEALWRAFGLAPLALLLALGWLLAVGGRGGRQPAGERTLARLAVLAAAWVGVVFAMALVGFAGLPRFSAPAGALLCVLGAVALVLIVERARASRALAAGAAVLVLLLGLQGGWRTVELVRGVDEAVTIGDEIEGMRALVDRMGVERFEECGALTISDFEAEPALAWELDRGVADVWVRLESVGTTGIALVGPQARSEAVAAAEAAAARGAAVTAVGDWRAYEISCSAGASAAAGLGAGPR